MDPVRDAVWDLVRERRVEVTQGGIARALDERDAIRGPIRVRRGERWEGWDGT
ncbi:hypothetical protein Q5752_001269 [Cryptotrichosporon argae]